MQPESLHIPGSDGLELHLLRWSREGVPMLLIHGFGNEAHIWDDFAPAVAPHYEVLALDLRGHGDSDWDEQGRYDYDHHLADLEAVIDALGFERVALVGHSLGGRVAIRYAGRHTDRMAGLVIVDSAPELDRRGTLRIQLDVQDQREPSFASLAEYENTLAHSYPAATPAAIRRMAENGLRRRDEDGRYVLKMDISLRGRVGELTTAEEIVEHERQTTELLWRALEDVACPTLLVRGAASDILAADVADRMVEEVLSKGRLAVVPQAGHSVMTDNPDGFRQAVCEFVLG
ncbi:MAG: alpha/beta hydrolase [Deltaproteobacteria bacterium]|nr:alpha/beta hydrolase [Deltaproteobacteria bacterium]MBW2418306.1 alpha/beta hydrolase [Deltaproteobacteria bacterium]